MKKLLVVGCVVLAIGGLLALAYSRYMRDEPPPEDAHLRPVLSDIPEEQNAFRHFVQASEKAYSPYLLQEDQKEYVFEHMLQGKMWDWDLSDELMLRNREAFVELELGLACPSLQIPSGAEADMVSSYLEHRRVLAQLSSLRALALFKRGNEEEAFDVAMGLVRFGHMAQHSGGDLADHLVGTAIKGMGLVTLGKMVGGTTLTPKILAEYVGQLATYSNSSEGLANACRAEYAQISNTIEQLVVGKLGLYDSRRAAFKRVSPSYFVFQPNRTKRVFAEALSALMRNSVKYYSEGEVYEIDIVFHPERISRVKRILLGNAKGNAFITGNFPAMDRLLRTKCNMDVSASATGLLLALKCYKLDTGRLPLSLTDLVPDYIDEVPRDDFDGEPMRYSRKEKIVYSVGSNLRDDGGSPGEGIWEAEDATYEIEF